MNTSQLRNREQRENRIDAAQFHQFDLQSLCAALRTDDSYRTNGHTGLLLLKTKAMRVVLEVVRPGGEIGLHSVRGPTVLHVIEGSLRAHAQGEVHTLRPGELLVLPGDRPRELHAEEDSAFLWSISLEG